METLVQLFQDIYQLYTFVQAQLLDDFVELNDRFECETLWRYPTANRLGSIVNEQNGRLTAFSKFEHLSKDIGNEYNQYDGLVKSNSDQTKIDIEISGDLLDNLHMKGAFQITLNPSDQNCINCFNARLASVKLTASDNFYQKKKSTLH